MEILESGIIFSTLILGYLIFPHYYESRDTKPYYFGKQESQQSIQESRNQGKIPESRRRKFTVADLSLETQYLRHLLNNE